MQSFCHVGIGIPTVQLSMKAKVYSLKLTNSFYLRQRRPPYEIKEKVVEREREMKE